MGIYRGQQRGDSNMSADRWAVCPRCNNAWLTELTRCGAEVEAAYGKVPADEYERLRSAVRAQAGKHLDETFREDYEIGIDGSAFVVSYHGKCTTCGLRHKFERRDEIAIAVAAVDPHVGTSSE
jgi:hypothetical protein